MGFVQRNRSVFIIAVVAVLLALWIASGVLLREAPQLPVRAEPSPMTVAVKLSEAQTIERLLTLQGEVLPDQRVTIRAETAGRIEAVPVARGEWVEAGRLLVRIAEDDRPARIRQAEAAVRGRESDHRAAQRLADSGFQGQIRAELAEADLAAARAALEATQLDLARTRIHAPITGVLNQRPVQVGSYVAVGDVIAEIVENDPLLAVVQVPQHQIRFVKLGMPAQVVMLDGERVEGQVSFISALADTPTRTFRIEVRAANPERRLASGVSAQVLLPLQQVQAHLISPALVALGEEGELGIKVVDDEQRVVLLPIEPVRADVHGVWVAGLPEQIRLITVGQGFVNPGEQVRVVNQAQDE